MGFLEEFLEGVARSLGHGHHPAIEAEVQHYIADGYIVVNYTTNSVTLKKEGIILDSVVTLGVDASGNVFRIN